MVTYFCLARVHVMALGLPMTPLTHFVQIGPSDLPQPKPVGILMHLCKPAFPFHTAQAWDCLLEILTAREIKTAELHALSNVTSLNKSPFSPFFFLCFNGLLKEKYMNLTFWNVDCDLQSTDSIGSVLIFTNSGKDCV